jgi:hypothetical protein
MVPHVRRLAASALLLAVVLVPSPASAQDPEAPGCSSDLIWVKNGRCDANRPVPDIAVTPELPRAGKPVKLTADSYGRGVTYAWDLDGDGAFDDANGGSATTTLGAGTHTVRARATDENGRTGSAALTLTTHAANLKPPGRAVRLRLRRRRRRHARRGRPRRQRDL